MRFARAGYRVWTFEPSPGKVAPIRAKLASGGFDGKVRLYPYALSNTTGTAPFVVNMGGRGAQAMFNGSGSAQDGLGAALWDSSVARVEQVPVRMLDELVPPNESVALLKVDAQGFDFQVLLGAERLLRRGVGVVIAEVSPGLAPGGAAAIAEMIGYMGRLGYRCARCASKGGAAHGDTSANSSSARGGAARPSEEFGAPTAAIPALEWATALADHSKATTYRGVNMGRWSDIVCRRERDQV